MEVLLIAVAIISVCLAFSNLQAQIHRILEMKKDLKTQFLELYGEIMWTQCLFWLTNEFIYLFV